MSEPFRILVADRLGETGLERLARAEDAVCDVRTGLDRPALLELIPDYDALVVRSDTRVDAELIAAGRCLRVIGRAGIGVDNIDVAAATARGVVVMNTPEANAIAAAEHTLMLMLAASRHAVAAHLSLAGGEWARSRFAGVELNRKTLGLVGFGRIARLVAARAQAFNMQVLAYDPYVSEEVGRELGVTLVDFEDLLAQADYVSLHAVASPETEQLIDAAAIARMKPGAIVLNAARGRLVDEAALAEALRAGRVRAAGVDVYGEEPPPPGHPLVGLAGVVHTPHLAASTIEAQADVAAQIADQVLEALRGRDFRNAINIPFHAGPDYASVLPYMELAEKIGVLQFHMAAPEAVRRVEIELKGDTVEGLARPVAAALLKGLLQCFLADSVNYINAPVLAEEHGIAISQTHGVSATDFSNVIACRAHWTGGSRVISGVLFGGARPRIVQVSKYYLDADPSGLLLIMRNKDVPGVIGQVGTILGAYGVNIGEWRMGRAEPGAEALSFINLDSEPPPEALGALERVAAITKLKLLRL